MNDNNLQQTLLQKEVTPPNNVWQKIAVALDELEEDAPLRKRILATDIHPPVTAWDEISQRLNEKDEAAQLLNKEVTAPVDMWERISRQLDKEADAKIAAKLIEANVTPPAFVWDEVEKELNQKQPAKIIPLKRSYNRLIQLAAAAAVTGVLAWGAYRLLNNENKVADTIAVTDEKTQQTPKNIIPEAVKEPDAVVPAEQSSSTRINVRRRIKTELKKEQPIAAADLQDHSSANTVTVQSVHHGKPKTNTAEGSFAENQYFVLLNENGDLVRVTKRINNMKCVKSEDLPVDATTALNTRDCNNQIKQWQEKMAMSTSLATASGILDIAEVIRTTDK